VCSIPTIVSLSLLPARLNIYLTSISKPGPPSSKYQLRASQITEVQGFSSFYMIFPCNHFLVIIMHSAALFARSMKNFILEDYEGKAQYKASYQESEPKQCSTLL